MAKYKIIIAGEEEGEIYDTYEDAKSYADYLVSCYHTGGETMEMSNPGDYPYDPNDEVEYKIIKV